MKKFKFIILMLILTLTFQNCSTIKEGFGSQKKNSTDEFLVEKKSPLVMPPEFNELPEPKISNTEEKTDDLKIKKLISDNDKSPKNSISKNKNLENLIIEKIKQN